MVDQPLNGLIISGPDPAVLRRVTGRMSELPLECDGDG